VQGSDANSGKTAATLSDDGQHYILNGQKMWITNAGFCDTQVVFAKIDNDRILSAFIVDSNLPGVVIGPDEHKMGIKGSSTAQIYYNDVKVPVENMLGSRGEGFRIALSILHMGRMKLGANVIGAAKKAISDAVKYANERKQFCVLISTFGAIQHKLAEMVIRTFAHESAIYRVSKDIDDLMARFKQTAGCDIGRGSIEAISHYAVEDAILKVYGSEMLDFVVDEALQIHGGMGYSAEMNVERGYRDSRINRIFEGTNEINRLLIIDTAMKRAMKGEYDLFGPAAELYGQAESLTGGKTGSETYYEEKHRVIKNLKKLILILMHGANTAFGKKLVREQEVLMNLADMVSEVYIAESLAYRVEKIEPLKGGDAILYKDILDVYLFDAVSKVRKLAMNAVYSFATDEEAGRLAAAASNLTGTSGVNVKEARRRIAAKLISDNTYKF
jgi:alkylation response protein AidB-like acyl-CoA dehydrogenase